MLYTPRTTDLDEVCAILASGNNVVTTAFLFHPSRLPRRTAIACCARVRAGRHHVHGSGLNPGNLSGVLPLRCPG